MSNELQEIVVDKSHLKMGCVQQQKLLQILLRMKFKNNSRGRKMLEMSGHIAF